MWLVVNNEMWNLYNAEGIVVEDNRVILIYPNHNEKFEAKSSLDAESMLCEIEAALKDGQKMFSGLPKHLNARSEDVIWKRFG